jgi:hypothetical protein
MKERHLNSFATANSTFTLAAALNLRRIWDDVLEQPVPEDLQRLIKRLEQRHDTSRHEVPSAAIPAPTVTEPTSRST